ncbi:MAG: hypothetical protein L0Z53_10555 [Acidobacteriales bacterium]|nr:hypothetical protein [Terriglobales bacterium]MCI0640021.1 hypothetical protein [Gemmataceae bacterium]MCI0738915.1 hypothetical protein [Gemmataceae bacterium]
MKNDMLKLAQEVNDQELPVLETLNIRGSGSTFDIATRLRAEPAKIAPYLEKLLASQLIEATATPIPFDNQIFRISNKGRQLLKIFHTA